MASVDNHSSQNMSIISRIADDITAKVNQVEAAVTMLDSGDTVPFISRYRKEATGGLTDTQLRQLEERLSYLRELENRRTAIISQIDEQGKLDDILHKKLQTVQTKAELEDLYLPFKKRRKTKGQAAIEAGLEPLANTLWESPEHEPEELAATYIDAEKGIADVKAAMDGAKFILMERFAEDAALIARLRQLMSEKAFVCSEMVKDKETEGEKFRDYFDYQELLSKVPSHRALAMFRGRSEGMLSVGLKMQEADGSFGETACIDAVAAHVGFNPSGKPADKWREQVVNWAWKIKLSLHLESDLFTELRNKADAEAIRVFASNLKDLLLAAPAGERCTLGLDPGYRSGVKVVVVDATGKVLDSCAIYPHVPQRQWDQSLATLTQLCKKHAVELIAIGNGTASKETDHLASELIKANPSLPLTKVVISEAGASVYSASEVAEREFPDLDVTIRGAISIARRLQDPLAELVKIDPKAIGVGQYQHDVSQVALARSLDATVEDCVNGVGVDLNTASAALLTRVAGLGSSIANNIVQFRDENGAFKQRKDLMKVPRLGAKAFEQSAGFLRIRNGSNPLDASGVHPETYPVVEKMVKQTGRELKELIGDSGFLKSVDPSQFVDDKFGLPTVRDILAELDKPGRDPRPEFRAVKFSEGVDELKDLSLNQVLEGQVTNVTNFGAFVDIGVHQDGLVHISAISDTFIKDPHEVLKAGEIVKVKVMSVDVARNRIGLSMRMSDDANDAAEASAGRGQRASGGAGGQQRSSGRQGSPAAANDRSARGKPRQSKPAARNMSVGDDTPSALALSLKAALTKKN